MADQRAIDTDLSRSGLTVHASRVPDVSPPDLAGGQGHTVQAEEIASMVDDVVEQANRVAREIEDPAAANEEQAAMVSEVETSVSLLSGDRAETDGGSVLDSHTASQNVSIPDDVPDEVPDSVIAMLSKEQLRDVARGTVDPKDLT